DATTAAAGVAVALATVPALTAPPVMAPAIATDLSPVLSAILTSETATSATATAPTGAQVTASTSPILSEDAPAASSIVANPASFTPVTVVAPSLVAAPSATASVPAAVATTSAPGLYQRTDSTLAATPAASRGAVSVAPAGSSESSEEVSLAG